MEARLDGWVALVTGGSKGRGLAGPACEVSQANAVGHAHDQGAQVFRHIGKLLNDAGA